MKIAIHQPNLFPYMGFFQKMQAVDVFVLLNHAQYVKGNFHNRFLLNGKWQTLPIKHRNKGNINEKEYQDVGWNWAFLKKSLPQYNLQMFDSCITSNIAECNENIIRLCAWLSGIKTRIIQDYKTELRSTERLVDICKTHKATEYLSGISGRNYLNTELFGQAGIEIKFQDESEIDKRSVLEVLKERKLI